MENPKQVSFSIDGDSYYAIPNYKAVAEIEAQFGGIMPMAKRIAAGDFTATEVIGVVCLALKDNSSAPEPEVLQEMIFDQGVNNFLIPVSTYLAHSLTMGK